jgi:CBS domain containing-hemolysin-like protein
VGDLRDGFDIPGREPSIRRSGDDGYEVDGGVSLSAVNDALGVDFTSEEFDTLGGLVLDRLGRPPEVGDVVSADGYAVEVLAVDGARVSTVRLRKEEPTDEGT